LGGDRQPEPRHHEVTLDAPLIEIGGLTATLLNSQTNPAVWRQQVGQTQKVYSWAMNNHWGTNYRAYQDGPTWFRFILRPHRRSNPADATRFATGFSQPLLPRPAHLTPTASPSLLRIEPAGVLLTALKPSDDGQAWIVRLFGASGRDQRARLKWSGRAPGTVSMSDTSEKRGIPLAGPIAVPAWGLVTLRVELPR
jgi:alpha-mannosidase